MSFFSFKKKIFTMDDKVKIVENWVHLYGDMLYNWAYNKTNSKEIAKDLVQETFIAAFRKYYQFENKSAPKTWLIAILNNKIIDYHRATKNTKYISIENNGIVLTDTMFDNDNFWLNELDQKIWRKENDKTSAELIEEKLKKCISNLPEKWSLAISYKYFSDEKTDAICQELNISTSNYWQIIHRAKLLLKKCVELQ
jgi:RNA polymerase sigma factor (sigma-70 family)